MFLEKYSHIDYLAVAHCIYQCDCQINQEIFAYNQGYPSAKSSSDTEKL